MSDLRLPLALRWYDGQTDSCIPEHSRMKNVQAICFDLDNTLWDLSDVIPRAETLLDEGFAEHYPRVAELYTPLGMRRKRELVDTSPVVKFACRQQSCGETCSKSSITLR